jgi:CBS domain-containing protein
MFVWPSIKLPVSSFYPLIMFPFLKSKVVCTKTQDYVLEDDVRERNEVRHVLNKGGSMMNITEVMTSNVETCNLKSSCGEVANKMKSLDVGVIPICEDGKLIGLITDRDLVVNGLANNFSANTQISEMITTDVITGTKHMSVEQAVEIMSQHQIRRLPIVEDGKLIGMVSLGDLAVSNASNKEVGKALEDISVPAEPTK